MAIKIIVSYDGTANEADAIALGGLFARAGARGCARLRTPQRGDRLRHRGQGAAGPRGRPVRRPLDAHLLHHRPLHARRARGAGHRPGRRGDRFLLGLAHGQRPCRRRQLRPAPDRRWLVRRRDRPAAFAERDPNQPLGTIVAVSDGDGGARETAESLAAALGATVAPVVNDDAGMIVLDSRAEAEPGRVSISSSAGYLIDVARCPVLVLPRSRPLAFGAAPAPLRPAPPSGSGPTTAPAPAPPRSRSRRPGGDPPGPSGARPPGGACRKSRPSRHPPHGIVAAWP